MELCIPLEFSKGCDVTVGTKMEGCLYKPRDTEGCQQPPEAKREIGKGFSLKDSPVGPVVKNPPANAGDMS